MTTVRAGGVGQTVTVQPDGKVRAGGVGQSVVVQTDGKVRAGGVGQTVVVSQLQATWVKQTATPVTSQSSWSIASGTPTNGNLLVAFLGSVDTQTALFGSSTAGPTATGWTERHNATARSAGGDSSGYVFWKWAGASEPANYTFTFPVSTSGIGHIIEITNVNAATPIHNSSLVLTAAGATQADISGFTTTVDGCLLLALAFTDEDSTGYEPYWVNPMVAGWTPRYGSSGVPTTQGGDTSYSGIASRRLEKQAATGTVTAKILSQNDAIVAYLVAVEPGYNNPVASGSADKWLGDRSRRRIRRWN